MSTSPKNYCFSSKAAIGVTLRRAVSGVCERQMGRALTIALASLVGAALAVPTAQAATRYRYFQDHALDAGHASIWMIVAYKDTHGNRKFTPRWVLFNFRAPTSCEVGGNPLIFGASPGYTRVTKLKQGQAHLQVLGPGPKPHQRRAQRREGDRQGDQEDQASRRNGAGHRVHAAPHVRQPICPAT